MRKFTGNSLYGGTEVGVWYYHFHVGRPVEYQALGWRDVFIGIFKFTRERKPGTVTRKGSYKGFILRFRVWMPIERRHW